MKKIFPMMPNNEANYTLNSFFFQHFLRLLVFLILFSLPIILSSCTSATDLYNPSVGRTITNSVVSSSLPQNELDVPDWIYSVDSTYLVGEGQGSSFDTAKSLAVSHIKRQLTRNLSEKIRYQEGSIVHNSVFGKGSAQSSTEFSASHFMESEYPEFLIRFHTANILDHFWMKSGRNIRYFIKYQYNSEDIEADLKRTENYFKGMEHKVDSLCNISAISSLEDLHMRQKELAFLEEALPVSSITLRHKIQITLEVISQIFDNLYFEEISSEPGRITFALTSGNRRFETQFRPYLIGPHQAKLSLNPSGASEWTISYDPAKFTANIVTVIYDGLDIPISTDFMVPSPEDDLRLLESAGRIKFVDINIIESSWLTHDVLKIKVRFINPDANNRVPDCIRLTLRDPNGLERVIKKCELISSGNFLQSNAEVIIPLRYLKRSSRCDLTLFYDDEEELHFQNVKIHLQ